MNADIKWLDDPKVFRVGTIEPHSDHRFYANEEEMNREESPLWQSLNGVWKFHYSENAKERPVDFYKEDFSADDFKDIEVPCHIEMAGYDKIHYINTMYPWEGHFYRRPAYSLEGVKWEGMFSQASYNPVGSYRKVFDLKKEMIGKRITVCFEGVEQAIYLWLNGAFIGYAEDSFTPSEFDLTPYIREKGNILAAEVHKRSTAAFLEDQDFFRFFGIFRNVTLYAKPKLHVEDLWAKPVADKEQAGSLALDFQVSMPENSGGKAEIALADPEGNLLLKQSMMLSDGIQVIPEEADADAEKEQNREEGFRQFLLKMEPQSLGKVKYWDNQNPCLYLLTLRLYDGEDRLQEIVPYRIGFRILEMIDKVIFLNGRRLILNGVNRHEWSAESGRCIGLKEMEDDMAIIKRNHINAVRTCHYPDQIPWYEMCDLNGIYLMAETNLESHGSWQKMEKVEPSWNVPGSLPEWKDAVMDRGRNNFETFKNHVSVLFWSLGNESYAGDVLRDLNVYFKEKKDGRLVHYEGVFNNRDYEDVISDVESRMYAPPEDIREYLANAPKKPFLSCEYMHSMGNSVGGMGAYMKLLDEFEMYQGGFIWDFIDQAVFVTDEVTGRKVLRYGGDFDDRPSNYEFSGNGIVFADRTEKPAMQEVRYYYGRYR